MTPENYNRSTNVAMEHNLVYMARTGESSKHHHPKFDDILYMYKAECPLCHHMENNEDCCLGCHYIWMYRQTVTN